MNRPLTLASFAAIAALTFPHDACAQHSQYNELVARHAKANGVPEALVHRVIVRESRYQAGPCRARRHHRPDADQARDRAQPWLRRTAEGLRDPDTNLTYAVKYLAGAWRAANGDHGQAVHYYASGYYFAAKRQRLEHGRHPEPVLASAPPKEAEKCAG